MREWRIEDGIEPGRNDQFQMTKDQRITKGPMNQRSGLWEFRMSNCELRMDGLTPDNGA
jgi:hypothetical protein